MKFVINFDWIPFKFDYFVLNLYKKLKYITCEIQTPDSLLFKITNLSTTQHNTNM